MQECKQKQRQERKEYAQKEKRECNKGDRKTQKLVEKDALCQA